MVEAFGAVWVRVVVVIAVAALSAWILGLLVGLRHTWKVRQPDVPRVETTASEPDETARLREQVDTLERQLARLEGGAVTAWDSTVPHLERRIEELQRSEGDLQAELRRVRDDLDVSNTEVAALRQALQEQRRPFIAEASDADGVTP